MKKLPVIMVVGVAASVAGYLAWQQGIPDDPLPARAPATMQDAAPPVEDAAPGAIGASAITARASNEPDCTVVSRYLPKVDGTAIEAFSCEPDTPREAHPYSSYPSAALESLAYSDAKAAEILGMRLIEDDDAASLSLVVRAAALSGGDPAPIRAYSSAYPHPLYVNGVPQRKAVHVKYVLDVVTALLDDESTTPNPWESVIREHSADPDAELAALQAQAQAIVEQMRRIQFDVSGTSTIGGPGDA